MKVIILLFFKLYKAIMENTDKQREEKTPLALLLTDMPWFISFQISEFVCVCVCLEKWNYYITLYVNLPFVLNNIMCTLLRVNTHLPCSLCLSFLTTSLWLDV